MLRSLNRMLPKVDLAVPEVGREEMRRLCAARDRALKDRAEADSRLRQAEAELRGKRAAHPDLAKGEIWSHRPAAWVQAAPQTRLASPASGTEVAPGLTLFHDGQVAELLVRQTLCPAEAPAPFSLGFDLLHFDGSFLSLCLHFSASDAQALTTQDLVCVTLDAQIESPLPIYARLNLVQAPNTREMIAEFPFEGAKTGRKEVVFDLAHGRLNEDRVTEAWLDLIFEKPAMNAVQMHDVVLVRKKRAEL